VGVKGKKMTYCPKCHDEFQDWVKVCPDCKVELVAKLPPLEKIKHPKAPLAHIATAPDEVIANMWAGILEKQGIHCLLNTGSSGAASQRQIFYVPVTLQVLASESKKATKILAPFLEA
jgi:hypothetical protein